MMVHLPAAEPELARAFGARVRELRRLRGLSQAALARALGIDTGTVARYERGETFPGDRVLAIARALGAEPVDLFRFGGAVGRVSRELVAIVALLETAARRKPDILRRALKILRALAE